MTESLGAGSKRHKGEEGGGWRGGGGGFEQNSCRAKAVEKRNHARGAVKCSTIPRRVRCMDYVIMREQRGIKCQQDIDWLSGLMYSKNVHGMYIW